MFPFQVVWIILKFDERIPIDLNGHVINCPDILCLRNKFEKYIPDNVQNDRTGMADNNKKYDIYYILSYVDSENPKQHEPTGLSLW